MSKWPISLPIVRAGGAFLELTASPAGLDISSRRIPGYHWWRVGVSLTRDFQPRVGFCNHKLYRGIVHRTALSFGVGGLYAMRMPKPFQLDPPLSSTEDD